MFNYTHFKIIKTYKEKYQLISQISGEQQSLLSEKGWGSLLLCVTSSS